MKNKKTVFYSLVILLAGIINVSYGQDKSDKLDKLISVNAEYGQFNGAVLVAEKGKVIYKQGVDWLIWNGMSPTSQTLNSD